jgi:hypothetical protein
MPLGIFIHFIVQLGSFKLDLLFEEGFENDSGSSGRFHLFQTVDIGNEIIGTYNDGVLQFQAHVIGFQIGHIVWIYESLKIDKLLRFMPDKVPFFSLRIYVYSLQANVGNRIPKSPFHEGAGPHGRGDTPGREGRVDGPGRLVGGGCSAAAPAAVAYPD